MKKIGQFTMKGSWDPDGGDLKLILDDGSFETGYRVVKFDHALTDPVNSAEYKVVVCTEETSSTTFDWGDNTQVAWGWGGNNASATAIQGFFNYTVVDPDNLIIQDLYLSGSNTSADKINYLITLEKYDITDWQGALAMVRNKSQG